jgi:hypothetical protein
MRKRCRQQAGGDRWAVDGRKHGHPCALPVWGSPPSPSFIYLLILLVIFQSRVKSCRCLIEYDCCQRTKSDAEIALLQNDHSSRPTTKATLKPFSTGSDKLSAETQTIAIRTWIFKPQLLEYSKRVRDYVGDTSRLVHEPPN